MKDYIGYTLTGLVFVIFVAVWIKVSWLMALIVSLIFSLFFISIMITYSARSIPLRVITGIILFLGLLLSVTAGKGVGFFLFLGVLVIIAAIFALLFYLGKRGHAFSGFWGGLQVWCYSLLGVKPLTVVTQTASPVSQKRKPKITVTKKAPYRFVGSDESISVAGYLIDNPLIYVTNRKDYAGADASIIYLGRRVSPPSHGVTGELGYWPRTSELTSGQMGAYLQWLSGGRKDPDMDLGYVFLFFYGLERRALLDEKNVEEIALEIIRLLGVYHHSRSFRDYATGLLIHLVMRDWLEPTPQLLAKLLNYQDKHISNELEDMLLGYLAKENIALPTGWALMLAQQDERSRKSVVTKRTPEEFENLFTLRYKEKYGGNLVPQLGDRQRAYHYRSASPSLASGYGVQNRVPSANWHSVSGWRRKFGSVVSIYNSCIDELKGYAQKSKTAGSESMTAYAALPAELREQMDHPLQGKWDAIIERYSPEEGGLILVPVSEVASLQEIVFRQKLTLSQSKGLASLVDTFSTSIEPDARYTSKPYKWNDYVAVLKLPDEPTLPKGQTYSLVSMLMPLAIEVSLASGAVEPEEASVIIEFFEERFMLDRNDRIRTEALMSVVFNNEISLSGLKTSISACFSEPQREAIGKFLVIIAAAADGVCEKEVQSLKKTFKALNIKSDLVQSFMTALGFGVPVAPVTVQAAEQHEAGEVIPPQVAALDESKIIAIIDDTNQIVDILAQATDSEKPIPVMDEPEELEEVSADNDTSGIPHLSKLRAKLHPVLEKLLARTTWPLGEVGSLVREHGLTVAAAVDEINEWSCEAMDDMLLEGEDPITINYGLLQGE